MQDSSAGIGVPQAWGLLDTARGEAVPGTVLVCATRRLAQAWLTEDAARQAAAGRRSWLKAPIVSYEQFLRGLHDRGRRADPDLLPGALEPAQEAALWRGIVDEATADRPLMRGEESARLAAEAWRLTCEWRLPLPFPECNGDVEQFNRWSARFRQRVQRLGLLDTASLPSRLEALLRARKLEPPSRLLLAGFDERTPAQAALFDALVGAGARVDSVIVSARRGDARRVGALDRERELRQAAAWAREALQRAPATRIGIVVTDLPARRADLQRVFDELLGPQAYNLSLGEPLAELSIVRTALRLLEARHASLGVDDATALLLSPYWGGSAVEHLQRAELDRQLREDGYLTSDLSVWQRIAERQGLPLVAQRIAALTALRNAPAKQSASAWTQNFAQWLRAAGWPGWRAPDSAEFQALQAWSELLGEYGALSAVLPPLASSVALAPLRELATRRMFQPRTPAVPVQVLTPQDALGLQFDRLWIMGLDDERWPPPPRPHPLIPFVLQRQAGVPRSSGSLQTQFAQRVLDRLRCAADEVVVSHPQQDDELVLAPSPLIADLPAPERPHAPAPAWSPRWDELAGAARLERIDDFEDPHVHAAPGMRGGTSVFKYQAICAFRGYATHRLRARALEEPGFGPSPIDRGEMVHKTMESLWRRLRSQAQLLALAPGECDVLVREAVDHGLWHVARRAPQRLGPAMLELERQRLQILVAAWLAMERRRAPFRVVEIEGRVLDVERAEPRSEEVSGIRLTLRPDRVDELAGGERVVLDYKTGNVKATPWFEPRPDEPQLLIYGLQQPRLGAVGFAILRAGRTLFRGASGPVEIGDGFERASGWKDLQQRWQRELDQLADEVRRGFAAVTPKSTKFCELCGLHALCRIRELSAAEEEGA